jgi:predicted O-linked N-acetylglucosamine transferase (SPINDLY family)
MKRGGAALNAYAAAARLDPALAEAWLGSGNALNAMRHFDEAGEAFDAALAINPRLAGAWLGRGTSRFGTARWHDAIAAFETSLCLRPDIAAAWAGIADTFAELGRANDAVAAYENALKISPGLAEAWYGAGGLYLRTRQYERAADALKIALEKQPDLDFLKGQLANCYALLCNWAPLEPLRSECRRDIEAGLPSVTPFAALMLGTTAAEQLSCAQIYAPWAYPPVDETVTRHARNPTGRIRVAYLSADFHTHPVSELAVGIFERHDRERFETIALALDPDDGSAIRRRLVKAFDRFDDVGTKSNRDIAQLVAAAGCDILVDLMGATQGNRTAVMAWRPAPVQATWLGYPGTTGADFIDYIIADSVVVAPDMHGFFSEKVVTLPGCYLPNDSSRLISPIAPSRTDQGLPEHGFVFGCFNNTFKITPEIFDRWMNLLGRLEHSVLWLSPMNDIARGNLLEEARCRGVAPDRLVFAGRIDAQPDHLARLKLTDLFLDTPGYNAHATTCDALWAGVPVLTCIGETFAGRVAASALTAVGLSEMITTTLDDYDALALDLARNPARLAATKTRLAANRVSYPLFDTNRFTRQLESAYTTMYERARCGDPPAAFAVASD